jgi:pSer/pThr/pTyr-binding forkhead associated (FHA) protein
MIPSAEANEIICPNCQHANIAGSVFCENCGSQLAQAATPPPAPGQSGLKPAVPAAQPPAAAAPAPAESMVVGRLVIQDSQVTLPIPPGKQVIIIGREDPVSGVFPDIDLDPHGGHEAGVGRRHAQLMVKEGQIYIEDLDSVNGTAVNRQRLAARQPQPLKSGDELRLGKMALIYYSN